MQTRTRPDAAHPDSALHLRRKRSNAAIGFILGAFVVLVFAITIVKMKNGASMEAFDHVLRPSLLETNE
ncbi:MAG: cytochrome C oxidase assembly protein [Rhodobacteraceae bacterium]|nr:cytochrome C oxidase assembly protein [Paracoccaceae bacterium]